MRTISYSAAHVPSVHECQDVTGTRGAMAEIKNSAIAAPGSEYLRAFMAGDLAGAKWV